MGLEDSIIIGSYEHVYRIKRVYGKPDDDSEFLINRQIVVDIYPGLSAIG